MRKNHQTGNLKSFLSDVRPEAGGASFQTSEGEHQHAFLRKDRFEIRDTRRMRKIFIKDIFNILLLSLIHT